MSWKKKLATCAALTSLASLTIYAINKITYFVSTIDNLLSGDKGTFYDWRFGKIFYTKKGSGKPILLVHDLSSCGSGFEWSQIESNLASTNTVYTLDLLGCGRSEKPNVTYTNFLYVQLITDFIHHVIGEKTDIVATGESGSFIIMACKNDPSIIDKVMMINPAALTSLAQIPTKNSKAVKFLISTPLVGTLLYNILNSKHNIENQFMTDYFYRPGNVDEKLVRTYYETAHLDNAHTKYLFASLHGKFTKANIIPCLKDITNSIFILSGAGNPENLQIADQYKEIAPSIESVALEKTKFLPQLESPELVLEQIRILFNEEDVLSSEESCSYADEIASTDESIFVEE